MMTEERFDVPRYFAERDDAEQRYGTTADELRAEGLLDRTGITALGLSAIERYKVDNAILMAAGFRHEKFESLHDKYGVTLLLNEDYDKYNNMSSLYVAQGHMRNSYILCSDNYYKDNVFHKYVYMPCDSCVYSDAYCDEYCVTGVDAAGYITGVHRGGARVWYTIGGACFDRNFSRTFVTLMNREWDRFGVCNMLMDDFHISHIQELKLRKVERSADGVLEFDTLEEFKAFEPEFAEFMERNFGSLQ